MWTSPNMITKYSPGNLVFEQDMIFHKKGDCKLITDPIKTQSSIDKRPTHVRADHVPTTNMSLEIR